MILLATNERDITSDYIVFELKRRSLAFCRLNTESISHGSIVFKPDGAPAGWSIDLQAFNIHLGNVKAAYFRRPGSPVPTVSDPEHAKYCSIEWQESLRSILQSLAGKWLSEPAAILEAENKPRQLALAKELGFRIPETIITNSASIARDFYKSGPTVGKPLKANLVVDGDESKVIFTSRIASLDDSDYTNRQLAAAPLILQREIEKRCDIRVTVVGEHIFCAAIDSQSNEETRTDWRRGAHKELPHRRHELPADLAAKCVALTRALKLRFGAIDLAMDLEGEYWFFEINPNGQWAWIENRLNLNISGAIVDELVEISRFH